MWVREREEVTDLRYSQLSPWGRARRAGFGEKAMWMALAICLVFHYWNTKLVGVIYILLQVVAKV